MSSKMKLKKTHSNSRECDICVSLVGPIGCGKSALLVKYLTHRFIGEYDPCYEGCWTKCENCDGTEVNLQIMDTCDKGRENLEKYFKWSDALILVYSVTSYESFISIQEYLEQIYEITKKNMESSIDKSEKPQLRIIVLGNKIDIERHRQVNKYDVDNLVDKYSIKTPLSADTITSSINEPSYSLNVIHLESTSCEEYELVQSLFQRIIRDVRHQRETFHHSNPLHIIEETSPKSQKSKTNSMTKIRTKSPKHSIYDAIAISDITTNNLQPANNNNVNNNNNNNKNNNDVSNHMGILPPSKDGSLKKNKFQFLNKILHNKNF